jgi:hypothetical protein
MPPTKRKQKKIAVVESLGEEKYKRGAEYFM